MFSLLAVASLLLCVRLPLGAGSLVVRHSAAAFDPFVNCSALSTCGQCLAAAGESPLGGSPGQCQWCYLGASPSEPGSCIAAERQCPLATFDLANVPILYPVFCDAPEAQRCFSLTSNSTVNDKSPCSRCLRNSQCVWLTQGNINGRSLLNLTQSGLLSSPHLCWTGSVFHLRENKLEGFTIESSEFYWSTCSLRSDHFVLIAFLTPAIGLFIMFLTVTLFVVFRARKRGQSWKHLVDEWFPGSPLAPSQPDAVSLSDNWDRYLQEERRSYAKASEDQLAEERALLEINRAEERRKILRNRHRQTEF